VQLSFLKSKKLFVFFTPAGPSHYSIYKSISYRLPKNE